MPQPDQRLATLVHAWDLTIEETRRTNTSLLAFGWRDREPVVLKIIQESGDEWRSGEIENAFCGRAVVRVLETAEGAVLLERILPGNSLVPLVLAGRDDEATGILANVIRQMLAEPPGGRIRVQERSRGIDRYLRSEGQDNSERSCGGSPGYLPKLCGTQKNRRLLHGDLHHENVIFDDRRDGWRSIPRCGGRNRI